MEQRTFSYTRQVEMKGLRRAILIGATLIGNEPLAIILADDYCVSANDSVLSQRVKLYEIHQCSIVAIEEVPEGETYRYGLIDGVIEEEGIYRISNMVEKPVPEDAPSNLAIIRRYIITPDIFDAIRNTPPSKNGEIQIADVQLKLAKQGKVLGYKFKGKRFDCGSIDGYINATNITYALEKTKEAAL